MDSPSTVLMPWVLYDSHDCYIELAGGQWPLKPERQLRGLRCFLMGMIYTLSGTGVYNHMLHPLVHIRLPGWESGEAEVNQRANKIWWICCHAPVFLPKASWLLEIDWANQQKWVSGWTHTEPMRFNWQNNFLQFYIQLKFMAQW